MSMTSKADDSQVIKDIIDMREVYVQGWIGSLDLAELEALLVHVNKYKDHPMRDTSLRSYATLLPKMVAIED